MDRSQKYVDRAVQWIRDTGVMFGSPIIDQGKPDQGDALSWRMRDSGEKFWFRTVDAKEAHQWVENDPPEKWGGFMLAKEGQLHPDWVYIVINRPMTRLAMIDMEKWSISLAEEITTKHPETGEDQVSIRMPYKCFKFFDLEETLERENL